MKRFSALGLTCLFLLPGIGCKSQAGAQRLDQFVGTWKAMQTLGDARGVRITSGSLTVKQPSADTITFGESSSVVTGVGSYGVPNMETRSFEVRLKQGAADQYLLSLKVDSEAVLTDLPLSYSESEGFRGQQTVMVNGKQQPVTASIKKVGSGSVWKIAAEPGSGTKRIYEFELQEKTK
ncbi:MAG: hypothetical protein ABI596_04445 [Pyrinomonadaceae bacterium]